MVTSPGGRVSVPLPLQREVAVGEGRRRQVPRVCREGCSWSQGASLQAGQSLGFGATPAGSRSQASKLPQPHLPAPWPHRATHSVAV